MYYKPCKIIWLDFFLLHNSWFYFQMAFIMTCNSLPLVVVIGKMLIRIGSCGRENKFGRHYVVVLINRSFFFTFTKKKSCG